MFPECLSGEISSLEKWKQPRVSSSIFFTPQQVSLQPTSRSIEVAVDVNSLKAELKTKLTFDRL